MTTESFARRIRAMNAMYRLPAHDKPRIRELLAALGNR